MLLLVVGGLREGGCVSVEVALVGVGRRGKDDIDILCVPVGLPPLFEV